MNRKADFFAKRIDSHNESNRIDSNRELECSTSCLSSAVFTGAGLRNEGRIGAASPTNLGAHVPTVVCRMPAERHGKWKNGGISGSKGKSPGPRNCVEQIQSANSANALRRRDFHVQLIVPACILPTFGRYIVDDSGQRALVSLKGQWMGLAAHPVGLWVHFGLSAAAAAETTAVCRPCDLRPPLSYVC